MKSKKIINQSIQQQMDYIKSLYAETMVLGAKFNDSNSVDTLKKRLANLESSCLFVVVGEVKTGKSSFINALLGETVCEVAPDPCTAVIQEMVYGEEVRTEELGEKWQRVYLPKDSLREISIVDTPGTNSVSLDHEAVTKKYIPQSDVVIAVFPSKNPHNASAWDLLKDIRNECHCKIVFVLQQCDIASQHELSVNTSKLREYARKLGIQNPVVYCLSAKREMEGCADSGFYEFRSYLSQTIERGQIWKDKVTSSIKTIDSFGNKYKLEVKNRIQKCQVRLDFCQKVMDFVVKAKEHSSYIQNAVINDICNEYEQTLDRLAAHLGEGLKVSTTLRRCVPLLRDKSINVWMDDLKQQFQKEVVEIVESKISIISNQITMDFSQVIERIQGLSNDVTISSSNLECLNYLRNLSLGDIFNKKNLEGVQIEKFSQLGTGLATVGGGIVALTKLLIFDITGGVFLTLGMTLLAVAVLFKRKHLLDDVNKKIAESKQLFRTKLGNNIKTAYDNFYVNMDKHVRNDLKESEGEMGRLLPLLHESENIVRKANLASMENTKMEQESPDGFPDKQ